MRNAHKSLVENFKGKERETLDKWEDNTKMNLREVQCDNEGWINLA
jgi:hypothetical protein